MSDQVRVEDLEVFAQFRAAMVKFGLAAENALSNADSDIAGLHGWLEVEQVSYWQGQMKKRHELLMRAKDALRQKKLYKDASGRTPGAVEEEKIVDRCGAAVEDAQRKLEAIKRALPRLEKEADFYRGSVSRLRQSLSDIPKGVGQLDRLAMALEKYVAIESAGGGVEESGVTRGGDAAAESPEKKKEGGDGAGGL